MSAYILHAPASLSGTVALPPSKSLSARALIINWLAGGKLMPDNLSDCDDTFVMRRALEHPTEVTDIMAAGTAMRFLTAAFAVSSGEKLLTGTPRMLHRPIGVLVDALRSMGAQIDYAGETGFPPLRVKGRRLEGGCVEMDGHVSSQYTSALLMIGPMMANGLHLKLKGTVVSRPYIDMTLQLMHHFGAEAKWTSKSELEVKPIAYTPRPYTVENDWSAASYWYEAVALCRDSQACLALPGLHVDSLQGDAKVQQLFQPLGVETKLVNGRHYIYKGRVTTHRYEVNLEEQPDLAQTVAVTCAMLGVPFSITGLQSLRIKETDRLAALKSELLKLGRDITIVGDDTLRWDGHTGCGMTDPSIDTYDDHRMALAFAPCACCIPRLTINYPEVVTKSYPNYWNDLRQKGFNIEER